MAGYSTTINTEMHVSGLDQLERASSLLDKLESKAKSLSGIHSSGGSSTFSGYVEGANKATASIEKLHSMAEKANITVKSSNSEQFAKQASEINKVTEAYKKMEAATKQSNTAGNQAHQNVEKLSAGGEKLRSSFKEVASMFSVGMLGASAVMGAMDGAKKLVANGWETLKQRQQGQAMWATSIQDAHGDVTGKRLTGQARRANDAVFATSLKAGNDFAEGNSIAKQIYSSDAGAYSGNVGKTNSMLKGMFNIQDANALNQREMESFKTAVGNIGDTGKMSGTIAKSLNLLDGKISRKIRQQYKKETGHELGKNSQGGWNWKDVDAQTAFKAIDKYGNSGGIGKASERYNSTLPGMLRSAKAGSGAWISKIMESFGSNIAKGGAFKDLVGGLSKMFTNAGAIEKNAQGVSKALSSVANGLGGFIKGVAPYASAFGKGAFDGVKSVFKLIEGFGKTIGGIGSKIGDMLPKGTADKLSGFVGEVGKVVGAIAAAKVAFAGIKGSMGLLKDGAMGLGKMIPGLSKLLGFGKNTPKNDSIFNKATGTFSAAVDRFAGGSAAGSASDLLGGSNGKKPGTRMERLHGSSNSGGFWGNVSQKGRSMQYLETNGMSRVARTGGFKGKLMNFAGMGVSKVGALGTAVSATKFGSMVGKFGGAVGKAGKFLGKGLPGLNAIMSGLDVMSVMGSTKSGSLARHKGVGGAVGGGVGAVAGGALGSLLGPLGTVAGGIAGQWVGNKVGSWAGSLFGGTKDKPSKASQISKAQSSAQAAYQKDQFVDSLGSMGISKKDSQSAYKAMEKASKSTSTKQQKELLKLNDAISNGDVDQIKTLTGQLKQQQKTNKKNIKKASPKKDKKASKGVYDSDSAVKEHDKNRKKIDKSTKGMSKSFKNFKKDFNKNSKDVTKQNDKMKNANNKRLSKMGKDIGKSFKSAKKKASDGAKGIGKSLKNVGKGAEKGIKKNLGKLGKSTKSALNKANKSAKGASKKFSKAFKNMGKGAEKGIKKNLNKISKVTKTSLNKANKTAKSASKKFAKSFKNMGRGAEKGIKKNLDKISKVTKTSLNKANKTAKSASKSFSKSFKNLGKGASNGLKKEMNKLSSATKSGMNKANSAAKSGATKITNTLKNGIKAGNAAKSAFSKLTSNVKSEMNKVDSAIKSGSSKWSSSVKSGADKATNSLKTSLNGMVNAAKSATSKVASSFSKIGSSADTASGKVKALQSAINGLKSKTVTITANVTGKGSSKLASGTAGARSAFSSLMPHYANGTTAGGHSGGAALVNDAPGSNWREAFMLPNGLVGLFPNERNVHTVLPQGTQVLDGNSTRKMFPRYANGTGGAKQAFGTSSGGSKSVEINMNINVNGNASANDADTIANKIGEKLSIVMNSVTI
ncbi:hypothetical protein G7084_01530 [Weissella coleopterorum]|uniref:Phage tail length tape-measure protein n=1 Tax=Weissella coleopterorum TaxID=2714949 RepID=A0A6G8AYN5_9LACO|nr:hypothetical protein [Weissella coleopterorum]QIL50116.1 hypothetical protein G7084_01530 [Weissella coleopterorum]